jgi:hypothetical protein
MAACIGKVVSSCETQHIRNPLHHLNPLVRGPFFGLGHTMVTGKAAQKTVNPLVRGPFLGWYFGRRPPRRQQPIPAGGAVDTHPETVSRGSQNVFGGLADWKQPARLVQSAVGVRCQRPVSP